MKEAALIMAAGSLGSLSRWGVGKLTKRVLSQYTSSPVFGTLAVNVIGCLLLGFLMQLAARGVHIPPWIKTSAAVGFLGAFTTFSTFGYETFDLLKSGAPGHAAANVAANLVLGLLAVWLGFTLARIATA